MESTFTGYRLHNKGWRSVYLYPKRPCFLGCTTIDMKDALVQLIKWSSGLLQVGLSKFSPMTYGLSNMTILQSLCYGYFTFMPLFSVPCLIYGIISPLCFLTGIPLFPEVNEPPSRLITELEHFTIIFRFAGFKLMVCSICWGLHIIPCSTSI